MPEPIIQPDIFLGEIRVAEPVTSLTALMISAICFYAWGRLQRTAPVHAVPFLIRMFFLLMGLATLVGGVIGHAFLYMFSLAWKIPGWVLSMVAIAALERAAIVHARPLMGPAWGRVFGIMNLVELATFMTLALATLNFHFVEVHAGYGLVVVVGLFEGYVYYRRRDPGSRLILLAIPVAAVAVAAHLAHFSVSVWFTYFDIGHVLMCVGAYMMLRGAEAMRYYDPEDKRARIFLPRKP
jgi:hypothetical protein